jgi:LPS export ABC transporter protein LptC
VAVIAAGAGIYFSSHFLSFQEIQESYIADIDLKKPILTHFDVEGRVLWEIRAHSIQIEDAKTLAQDVKMLFFEEDKIVLRVSALTLELENRSSDIILKGNVKAQREDLTFETEEALWDEESGVLRGKRPVIIMKEDVTIRGEGFEYIPEEGKFIILKAHLQI